jgi:hypothetical protein
LVNPDLTFAEYPAEISSYASSSGPLRGPCTRRNAKIDSRSRSSKEVLLGLLEAEAIGIREGARGDPMSHALRHATVHVEGLHGIGGEELFVNGGDAFAEFA